MDEKVDNEVSLRGIAEKGFIRFSIKADDTLQNESVHAAFKEFCALECDNNYTLGLRKLLEAYENDGKFEALWARAGELERRIDELSAKPQESTVKKDETKVMF